MDPGAAASDRAESDLGLTTGAQEVTERRSGGGAEAPAAAREAPAATTPGASSAVGPQQEVGGAATGSTVGAAAPGERGAQGPLLIGIPYTDLRAVYAAFGAQGGPGSADREAMWRVALADLRKRGGIGGRAVEPVFFRYDVSDGASAQSVQEQSACADFTQDHKVFAVLGLAGAGSDNYLRCLDAAGVLTLTAPPGPGSGFQDAATYKAFPLLAGAGGLALDRGAAETVDGLVSQGFFGRDAKIGVLTHEGGVWGRTLESAVKPALARHRLTLRATAQVPAPTGLSDIPAAQIQNAVLRFRSEGVTHVLPLVNSGGIAFLFMQAAESQGYRPRYGLNTFSEPAATAGQAPAAQLAGARAVGWAPGLDVGSPGATAARDRCDAVMRAGGQVTGWPAWQICQHLGVFEAALAAAGARPSPSAVIAQLPGLTVREPQMSMQVAYGGGRRDGTAAAAPLAYASDCGCFRYVGTRYRLD